MWRRLSLGLVMAAWAAVAMALDVKGVVVDSDSMEPLPFANVKLSDNRSGTLADEQGRFVLKVADNAVGNIRVSCIGYEMKALKLKYFLTGDSAFVKLVPQSIPLQEVRVMPTRKIKHITIGKKHSYGLVSSNIGDIGEQYSVKGETYGYEIKDTKHTTWLKSVGFYIKQCVGMLSNMKFRIHVYDMSGVERSPSDKFVNVLSEPIYFDYRKDDVVDGKFTYALPNPIQLPARAMVAIELLDGTDGEYIVFKSSVIGGRSWQRSINANYWETCPFCTPFFFECVQGR